MLEERIASGWTRYWGLAAFQSATTHLLGSAMALTLRYRWDARSAIFLPFTAPGKRMRYFFALYGHVLYVKQPHLTLSLSARCLIYPCSFDCAG